MSRWFGLRRDGILPGLVGVVILGCATRHSVETSAGAQPGASPPSQRTDLPPAPKTSLFEETVKPVLRNHCTPCHVPGGLMYGRLPFDDPAIVLSKREGILRRLKVPEDRRAIEEWIATQTPP
jgi:hypothetical protein